MVYLYDNHFERGYMNHVKPFIKDCRVTQPLLWRIGILYKAVLACAKMRLFYIVHHSLPIGSRELK